MKKRSEPPPDWEGQRAKIIGLGETSIRKSYYPELQQRIGELERKNAELNAAYEEKAATEEQLRFQFEETSRKEQELRRSEERFRNLIDASPVPVLLARDGKFVYVNHAFCTMTGHDSMDEIVGKNLLDFVAPEFRETVAGYVRARSRGEPAAVRYESMGLRKDGSRFPYEISVAVIPLSDGPVTMAFVTDISERKAADEALKISGARLKRAEQIAHIGHWEFSLGKNTVTASDGARSIYGLTGELWTIPEVQKIPLPEYRTMLDDTLRGLVHDGRPYDVEFRIRRSTDNALVDVRSIAEYDAGTNTVFGVIQDVTERNRASEALRKSERRFSLFMENLPAAVYIKDADGNVLFSNQYLNRLFGWSDPVGRSTRDLLPRDVAERMIRDDRDAIRRGTVNTLESVTDAQGNDRIFSTTKFSLPDPSGSPLLGGISLDITELRRAEAVVRESENKYRAIVEASPDLIWEIDTAGRFTFISPKIYGLFGYRAEELLGKPFSTLLPPDQIAAAQQQFERQVRTGQDLVTIEKSALHADGHRMEVEIRSSAARDSGGTLTGFRGITRDITEARRAASALEQARKKLNLLNIITFQDIQTAAFSLSAYQILANKYLADTAAASYAEKESALIRKIITSLEFAKNFQDMGIQSPRWQNVSQTLLFAISHLDFLKISHTFSTENLEIYADPLLEKAFSNIMENVLRHAKTATEVRAWYEQKPDGVVLFIEDNGPGIPREEKHIIFDRSYGKDTGLGLFLVREILSITGIAIRETGESGKGARFELHIPPEGFRFVPSK
ncbi:PAS domain S-box protein [Methanoregula sp. PtaB.Bin085]|uniref:PAS domain S-box protein n=1 Tax=Methanoregula sp. PtaB.Bin085 TaxID=1811680 RepID=UPI0009C97EBC|nr:PAS domain S-box protein [Methanoregula sp. PtaB.Bin085]OPX63944.1 MAG: putative diguanylate cyclase [Methanoregula sp. PtaB.Bin085]